MRRKDAFDRDALHFAPFVLLPSPFPRSVYSMSDNLDDEMFTQVYLSTYLQGGVSQSSCSADSVKQTHAQGEHTDLN